MNVLGTFFCYCSIILLLGVMTFGALGLLLGILSSDEFSVTTISLCCYFDKECPKLSLSPSFTSSSLFVTIGGLNLYRDKLLVKLGFICLGTLRAFWVISPLMRKIPDYLSPPKRSLSSPLSKLWMFISELVIFLNDFYSDFLPSNFSNFNTSLRAKSTEVAGLRMSWITIFKNIFVLLSYLSNDLIFFLSISSLSINCLIF
jgi:hypothetical protein